MHLPLSPTRTKTLVENLTQTLSRITSALSTSHPPPRLVLVSKLKPANEILALHTSPEHHALHFGENYVQELLEKSKVLPKTIRWHFIGGLQSNKCKTLAEEVRGLWCVESVDTEKKASLLDKGRGALSEKEGTARGEEDRLRVFVQINTSGEEGKSGVQPGKEAVELCRFVREQCPHLWLMGVMTIGAIARSRDLKPGEENEDFLTLKQVGEEAESVLRLDKGSLELSMGMSADFESAIRCGSSEVRVGRGIFGERPAKKDAKILGEGKSSGG